MKVTSLAILAICLLFLGCSALTPSSNPPPNARIIYKCFDGRLVSNISDCAETPASCPPTCDDNDMCTIDSCSESTNFLCVHVKTDVCCGDYVCSYNEGETCASCPQDCRCNENEICLPQGLKTNQIGCLALPHSSNGEIQERIYTWNYSGRTWGVVGILLSNTTQAFYKSRAHNKRPYDIYVSDEFSLPFISELAAQFKQIANKSGLSSDETVYLVASFVQSLPYTIDEVTAAADEYPRFPYETLYENGGDCEDTSILTAAILRALGYDAVLINMKNHMAAGVRCSLTQKDRINYNGIDYCYLETTGEGWEIGRIPPQYKKENMTVLTIIPRSYFLINSSIVYIYQNFEIDATANVTIKNLGSVTAQGVRITVSIEDSDGRRWGEQTYKLRKPLLPEEEDTVIIKGVKMPGFRKFRVVLEVRSDNSEKQELRGAWLE
ncbi:MAG: hypothetical protein QXW70_03965 [Candidatus Anstonellales archaeon]